jgi:hypothetical protein
MFHLTSGVVSDGRPALPDQEPAGDPGHQIYAAATPVSTLSLPLPDPDYIFEA